MNNSDTEKIAEKKNISEKVTAFIDGTKCIGCGSCKRNCEASAINRGKDYYVIDENKCIGCMICSTKCPADAITYVEKVS